MANALSYSRDLFQDNIQPSTFLEHFPDTISYEQMVASLESHLDCIEKDRTILHRRHQSGLAKALATLSMLKKHHEKALVELRIPTDRLYVSVTCPLYDRVSNIDYYSRMK
jgi:hypothetical protein